MHVFMRVYVCVHVHLEAWGPYSVFSCLVLHPKFQTESLTNPSDCATLDGEQTPWIL